MNLPNKITISRIIISIILLIIMVFPFDLCGINIPKYLVHGNISVNLLHIIAGIIFIFASLTDFLDGRIARKRKMVTDFGKVMDAIADKILVNGVLIILASNNMINCVIPVIIITRDIFVDSIKMVAGNKGKAIGASFLGKAKTACMMIGITLTLFYNIPFEFVNIDVANGLLYLSCILSLVSGVQYYINNKQFFINK